MRSKILAGLLLLTVGCAASTEEADASGDALSANQCSGRALNNSTLEHAYKLPAVDDTDPHAWATSLSSVVRGYPQAHEGRADWYEFLAKDVSWGGDFDRLRPQITLRPAYAGPRQPGSVAGTFRMCAFAEDGGHGMCSRGTETPGPNDMNGCCIDAPADQSEIIVSFDLDRLLVDSTQKVYVRVEQRGVACGVYDILYSGAHAPR